MGLFLMQEASEFCLRAPLQIHNRLAKSVEEKVGIAGELCQEPPRQCYDECVSGKEMYFPRMEICLTSFLANFKIHHDSAGA